MLPGTFTYSPALGAVLNAGSQTLSVLFTPTDTTNYSTATRTVTLLVNKATPVVTWTAPAGITQGTPLSATQLNATAAGITGAVLPGTFTYTPAAGTILGAGTQTLSVLFTPTDAANYSTATQTTQIAVGMATPVITWATPAAVAYGTALSATQLNATAANLAGNVLPGTFTYSPALGAVLNAGSQTLSVLFTPTDTTNYSTATRTVTLLVNKATPAVTWTAPAGITQGTPLSATQLNATAAGITGAVLPGTFTYTPAAGTILGAGTQTLSVLFTPTDAANYSTATQTTQIAVGMATPVITWATPAAVAYGTALSATQLNATAANLAGNVLPGTFTYSPALGAVLNAGSQTLSVLFTPTDTTNYSTATRTVTLLVNKATPVVTWTAPAGITQGTPLSATQLNATAVGITGAALPGTFTYTPAAGTILGAGTQTLSVLFTPTDAANYSTATQTTQIAVGMATPVITWATPAAVAYGTALSATQLNATAANLAGNVLPGTFTYSPAIGAVLNAGSQTLSVLFTPTDTTNYSTATRTVTLLVNKATPAVTWTAPAGITQGTPLSATQLNATAAGITGAILPGTFTYTPAAGTILGAGTQTLSVLFTPTDAANYSTATQTTQIAVGMATPVITWATPAAVAYGTALSATQLNATAANLAGNVLPGTFTYSPALGAVLNAGSQTLSVLFTPTDTTNYSTATRTVTLLVNKATPVVTWTAPAGITQGTPLSATQLNATAAGITGAVLPGTFTYTPAAGTILGAGTQTLSVLFTPTDAANYSTATQTTQIAVGMATPVITWATPAAVAYGTALSATQLNATAANLAGNVLPGTFTYSPALGAVLNAGSQTLSVLFTPTDTTNYSTATRTVTLLVNKATPAVTWTAPAGITQGTPLSATQLNATAVGITGAVLPGTFTYTPAAGTILGAGTQTLSVLFTPTDAANYSTATQTTQIAVGMATPVITWATPAAVAYGTALSATQLNATAANLAGNVLPGTFTYSPALGAVLNAGSQTLSVLFTPTDTTNYSTATRTVTLLVNKATPVVTWTAPAGITQGTPLSATQLNATAVGITGAVLPGTFTYTPAAGTILGAGTQTLSVLFTPTDAANYSTATQTTQIAVGMATPVITWATPAAVAYGTALSATQLNATAANLAGNVLPGTFTYSPAIGAVLNAGSQTLSVLFTPTDTTNYSTATRTVTLLVNKATPVVTWTAPAGITQGTPLSATQLNATAAGITGAVLPGTFTYTPAAGTILGAGTQTLSVLFTPTDAANYSTATQTTQIAVGMATPVITWATPAAVAYGTALSATQLNATAANLAGNVLPGTFTYSPALGAVLNAGSQTLSVLFTPTDTTNYSTATRTVTLLVNKATPAVTWTAPAGITQGTPLSATQLNATAVGITGAVLPGTFTYTPAAGTILGAGTQTLSVLFTPTDAANYSTATQTTQIAVGMATPVITWATPAAVAYGTALSATQLNATAANLAGNVLPGTFTYSPALGAVLNAGSQTLSVLFTPTDTTNYSTATRTVTLLVNKATPVVTWTAPAGITQGTPLSATQLNATAVGITGAVLPGTFTYTPAAGTILGAGTQTLSVLFTPTDAANYSTATQTTQIAVGMATPVITWATPAAVAYGTALSATQLNATAANLAGNVLPGTFTYSPALGAVLNAGSQTLSVLFTPTDTTNYSTATRTVTLLVNKATPAVTWTAPAGITQGTPLSATQLNATAVGITGAVLPGTFTYTPAAGTILGAGTQTLSVLFTPTDAANYSTATQTTQIAVGMATPVITWATPAAVAYGTALSATQLNATAANLAGNVLPGTFTYSPALGAVLNAGSQTLSVLFTPTDTTNYSTATRTVTLLVNKATPVVTWTAPAGITQGTPLSATQLNATAVGITGAVLPGTFTYTPAAGTILGAGTQTLSVLFTPTDAANYSTATQTTQIAVGMATPVITWATPAAVAYGTALSATQLNATAANLAGNVLPGTFTYSPAIGAVLNAGSQTLSVLFTPTDTTNYSTATRTVTLLVNKATPAVTWTAPAGITQGTPLSATQLNATAAGITGAVLPGTFTYTPAAGTILGAGTQTLSVLFTPTDAANYSTATQTTQIAVGMATPVITWATPAAVAYGTALSATQLNATAANLAGNVLPGTFTYSPALGAVLNAGSQTLSVLFTPTDTTNYSTATRTVTLLVNKATPVVTWTAPAGITQGTPLSATQLNATAVGITGAVLPGTFTYTPAAGTILGAGTQTLSVLFTPTDAANYSTATQTTQIAVGMATPVITWATPAAVAYGTALSATQLNATAANLAGNVLPGTFTYSPALGAVLNAGSQTLSVLFTPTDTTNYSTATRTVTLLVNKATPAVTWTAPAGITQGTPLSATQLNATAVGITGAVLPGTFTYTPAAGTILGAGTQTLSVLFTPTDAANYSTATQTTQIAVGMATPVITWATPAAVAYGTALSATQLNATAANLAGNVLPGTFTYSPAIGAVLNAGSQTLSVLFTPTDTTNYSTATRTVTLLVNKATPVVTWTAPAGITQGTPLSATQLNATAVGITGAVLPGTFTYTPAAGTILGAGTQTLSVLFTPTDAANYSTATQTTQIAVGMATPVITWATPAAVAYGTALSATQLNATAANLAGNVLPGTFTYSPALGAVLNAGSQTLSVLFTPTDTTNYSTATRTVTLLVNKATPVVTWTAPAGITQGTPLSATQLNATAVGITGAVLPGTFTYTPAAGTILGAGTQTLSVLFTPTDAANYSTATQTTQIAVGMATPVITWATPAAVAYGTALSATQLNATAANLAGNVLPGTFTYSPALGAVLNAGSQTLSVLFTPTDTTNYSTATRTVTLLVNKATPVVAWTAPAGITQGTPLSATQLNATAVGITGAVLPGTFTYTPAAGTILGAGTQTLSVLFTPTDAANYSTATQTTQIAVGMATPVITWATPAAVAYGTALSATQLNATAANLAGNVLPGTFTYSPAIGAVLNAGSQTLSVLFTPTDTTNYSTATRTVTLLVNKATPVVTWTAPAGITQGTPLSATQLNATAVGITGAVLPGTFTYTPAAGTILGAGTQTLSVLFTPTDAANYSTATQTTTLIVGKATPVITWTMPAGIGQGTQLSPTQLNATATGIGGAALAGTFAYTPAAGTVLNAGTQTLSVLFTPTDLVDYTTATQTTTIVVGKGTPVVNWLTPAPIMYGTALTSVQLNATASTVNSVTLPGTFAYTPAAGTVLGIGSQTLSVLFTPTDTTNYNTATKTVSLVVSNPATNLGLTSSVSPSQYGQPVTLTASVMPSATTTALPTGSVVFRDGQTMIGTVPLVNNTAVLSLSMLATGSHSISASYAGDTNYGPSGNSLTQVVGQGVTQISWTPTAATIVYGTGLGGAQLNATASTPYATSVAGTFIYTPATGTVLNAGTQTLNVTFTPTDAVNYQSATSSTAITVQRATPILTWATPASVVAGTTLSATQLNATAAGVTPATATALQGTFTYTPPAGTTVQGGTQTLSVLFTPTDATNYTSATKTVQLQATNLALISLSTNSALLGDPDKTITLTGAGFLPASTVLLNNLAISTTYVSPTTLTAVISAGAFQTVQKLTITVSNASQSQLSNSLTLTVTAPPVPVTFSGPGTAAPAAQPAATLTLTNPYPAPLTGTVTLKFTPPAGAPDDPAIQFASGGRILTFVIPAKSTVTPNIQFQDGTVSGAITLTLSLMAGGVDVTPTSVQPLTVQIPPAVPGITSATFTQSGANVTVTLVGYSNTVQVNQAVFHFTAASGGSLKNPDVTIDVGTLFSGYYGSSVSATYGSEFTYSQTFTLSDNTPIGSVSATLTNSVGVSAAGVTFPQ